MKEQPRIGWKIEGVVVSQTFSCRSWDDWLSHFRFIFPEKAKRMDEYSKKQGWGKSHADRTWYKVILSWLDKNGERNE
jgi:hypothetical protein